MPSSLLTGLQQHTQPFKCLKNANTRFKNLNMKNIIPLPAFLRLTLPVKKRISGAVRQYFFKERERYLNWEYYRCGCKTTVIYGRIPCACLCIYIVSYNA
jgi:hypothetical protein